MTRRTEFTVPCWAGPLRAELQARYPALAEPSERFYSICRKRFCDRALSALGCFEFEKRLTHELLAERWAREIAAILAERGEPPDAAARYLAESKTAAESLQSEIWEIHQEAASTPWMPTRTSLSPMSSVSSKS